MDSSTSTRQVKEGDGWRLGWNPASEPFVGLVGGAGWAMELTREEWQDFCRLVLQLAETLEQMSHELMDEERICCDVESDRLWLEAEGYPHAYELHIILRQGRRAEGTWAAEAVPGLVQASQTLHLF
ncbi:MAG: DUF1818 family protein [Leptolyngbya sp. DLM2.Bin15]|nr:MAG: DUF1818 family protein [Leptolyngbya sp. DLM2.Bin15]